MVELQSLTLVDGDETDTISGIAMDALFMDGIVPFRQEGLDVAAIICQIAIQLVIERADIGTLLLHFLHRFHLQDAI